MTHNSSGSTISRALRLHSLAFHATLNSRSAWPTAVLRKVCNAHLFISCRPLETQTPGNKTLTYLFFFYILQYLCKLSSIQAALLPSSKGKSSASSHPQTGCCSSLCFLKINSKYYTQRHTAFPLLAFYLSFAEPTSTVLNILCPT